MSEEKKQDKPIDMTERLFSTRTLTLFEQVDNKVAKNIIQSLILLENDNDEKPIYLYVNSPGGEVNSGFAIYDMLRFIKPEIKILCSGLCASIATIILLGTEKKNRISLPNSKFLIHQPLIGGVSGPVSDIEITANQIVKTREKINALLSRETGQSIEKITIDTDRDYWMNAQEALEYGLISKIIESRSEI